MDFDEVVDAHEVLMFEGRRWGFRLKELQQGLFWGNTGAGRLVLRMIKTARGLHDPQKEYQIGGGMHRESKRHEAPWFFPAFKLGFAPGVPGCAVVFRPVASKEKTVPSMGEGGERPCPLSFCL